MKTKNLYLLGLISIAFLGGCTVTQKMKDKPYVHIQKEDRAQKKWKLVWEDNFEGTAIDSTKWSRIPKGESDWNRHMSTSDAVFRTENWYYWESIIQINHQIQDHLLQVESGARINLPFNMVV